ncbi:helix-hairpin-helix domain-containing protein [Tumidithrix elongata]|uniref:helix-hairpin-helix domain-containing protein n=1 Tax=Tumidithrix elongata TaxID=3088357 RepID=UPI002ED3072B
MTQLKLSRLSLLGVFACLAIVSGCSDSSTSSVSSSTAPSATVSSSAAPKTEPSKPAQGNKINVNTAPIAELDKLELPGTKPSLSERIQGARPYKDAKDLVSKKAISEEELKLIENLITVGDVAATPSPAATTAANSKANSKKINVNTAPIAELDKLELPGTKPSLSERIQGARPYKDAKELVSKKAISEDELKLIENLITFEEK